MMQDEDIFDLLNDFTSLAIEAPASRESGLISIIQMPWNSPECRIGLEYKNIYLSRMQKLRHRFNIPGVIAISDVIENNQRYCISGTIKRLEQRRVRAFQKEFAQKSNSTQPLYNILDELEIEDYSGKLKLNMVDTMMGNRLLKSTDLPFGVQIVLQGRFKKHSNKFAVKHIYLPSLPPQSQFSYNYINNDNVSYANKKMLVLSEPTYEQCQYVSQLLQKTYSPQIRSITAVTIIGGVEMKTQSISNMATIIKGLKDIVDVFIMPSSNTDRRKIYPLQPYNGNFFNESKEQIALCSNPQQFTAENGVKIHITCGQNVIDFMKNCSLAKNELQVLQNMINFSHYCPTSPFSLKTQPYMEDDLVMKQIPHIMITGKSKQFGSNLLKMQGKQVLLVTIPKESMGLIGLNDLSARSFK